jgi:hypothetical protein
MIRLELTEAELQAFCGFLDAGVKATGLRAVKDAAVLLEKLEAAKAAQMNGSATTPPSPPDDTAQAE